jgi:succinylglutamate desuccinylase
MITELPADEAVVSIIECILLPSYYGNNHDYEIRIILHLHNTIQQSSCSVFQASPSSNHAVWSHHLAYRISVITHDGASPYSFL